MVKLRRLWRLRPRGRLSLRCAECGSSDTVVTLFSLTTGRAFRLCFECDEKLRRAEFEGLG